MAGTRKRKLGIEVGATFTVRYKRAKAEPHATALETPEPTPLRRNRDEPVDDELASEAEGGRLRILAVPVPPPATPINRHHSLTGLLTPAGSSDRDVDGNLDVCAPSYYVRDPKPDRL